MNLQKHPFTGDSELLKTLFDVLPALIFVFDREARIVDYNAATTSWLGDSKDFEYLKRPGELLQCQNVNLSGLGCGYSNECKSCLIRSTFDAAKSGNTLYRKNGRMLLRKEGQLSEVFMLVTAAPLNFKDEDFVMTVLEDISELIQLRSLIPICSSCKKVRDDKDYWQSVEQYISERVDVDFTHSICPECKDLLYKDFFNRKNEK